MLLTRFHDNDKSEDDLIELGGNFPNNEHVSGFLRGVVIYDRDVRLVKSEPRGANIYQQSDPNFWQ